MIIQKYQASSGVFFTVRTDKGENIAASPIYETDGLCHQAALRLIDGLREGVNIMPAVPTAGAPSGLDAFAYALAGFAGHN